MTQLNSPSLCHPNDNECCLSPKSRQAGLYTAMMSSWNKQQDLTFIFSEYCFQTPCTSSCIWDLSASAQKIPILKHLFRSNSTIKKPP